VGETNWEAVDALTDEELEQVALSDPDAPPTTPEALAHFQRAVDVKVIRERLGFTQEEFAVTFHLSLETLRDWEQAKSQPDQIARTLLKVIAHNPEAVKEALTVA
jgi:putative transcriptional regulator